MDGIFGVGISEMIIIALVILIIGGPRNAAKWARELGRMTRQAREMWQATMRDLEKEIGPDGRELMKATRELQKNVGDLRNVANPTRTVAKINKLIEENTRQVTEPIKEALQEAQTDPQNPLPEAKSATAQSNGRYTDWTMKD